MINDNWDDLDLESQFEEIFKDYEPRNAVIYLPDDISKLSPNDNPSL